MLCNCRLLHPHVILWNACSLCDLKNSEVIKRCHVDDNLNYHVDDNLVVAKCLFMLSFHLHYISNTNVEILLCFEAGYVEMYA